LIKRRYSWHSIAAKTIDLYHRVQNKSLLASPLLNV